MSIQCPVLYIMKYLFSFLCHSLNANFYIPLRLQLEPFSLFPHPNIPHLHATFPYFLNPHYVFTSSEVPTRVLHASRIKFSCLLRIEDLTSVCVPVMSPEVSLAYYTPGLPATIVRAPSANSFPIWSLTHSTYLSYLVPLRTTCDFFNKNFVALFIFLLSKSMFLFS